jgi:hypothetical protein
MNDEVPGLTRESRKILDSLPGFIWFASSEGTIKYINKGGLECTGFSTKICIRFQR